MSATGFPSSLAFTLKFEGGKSDNSHDPGGRTNQGVTQNTYNTYLQSEQRPPRDVYAMTPAERDEIYKREYWDKVTGESLPDGVDLCVFDFAVNSGPNRALRTYASVGHGKQSVDVIHAICSCRLSFLHALGAWSYFGTGWAKRVAACEVEALKLANAPMDVAHGKIKGTQNGLISLAVIFITAISTVTGKAWYELSHWHLVMIGCATIILLIYFLHIYTSTQIRIATLANAIAKEVAIRKALLDKANADMKAADAAMKSAVDTKAAIQKM